MAGKVRATKVEYEIRINTVFELLLTGLSVGNIYGHAILCGWGIGYEQVRKYVQEATKRAIVALEEDMEGVFALEIKKRDLLYRKLFEGKDFKGCLEVLKDRSKLLKLYDETTRHIVEVKGVSDGGMNIDYSGYTDEELERAMRNVRKFIDSARNRGSSGEGADKQGTSEAKP